MVPELLLIVAYLIVLKVFTSFILFYYETTTILKKL